MGAAARPFKGLIWERSQGLGAALGGQLGSETDLKVLAAGPGPWGSGKEGEGGFLTSVLPARNGVSGAQLCGQLADWRSVDGSPNDDIWGFSAGWDASEKQNSWC